MTYEKWKAYYDLAGKHPVVADLEHNVLFALGDWIDDHNVLTTRLDAAEARVLRVMRGEFGQICSFCGWEASAGGGAWEDLQAHIKVCPSHPLRAAETTCQSLLEQSSRWEAQALEAGVRIAELEALVRELSQWGCMFDDGEIPACPHNKQLQRQEWCLSCRADAALAGAPPEQRLSSEALASVKQGLTQKGMVDRGSFAVYVERTETITMSEATKQALAGAEPQEGKDA